MNPERATRLLAVVISAAFGALAYGIVMAIATITVGARPLPISYLVAAAAGAAVGYWKSSRFLGRRRQESASSEEPRP